MMRGRLLVEVEVEETPLLTTDVYETVNPPRLEFANPDERALLEERIPEEEVSVGVAVPVKSTDPYLIETKVTASTLVLLRPRIERSCATILSTFPRTPERSFEFNLMLNPTFLAF
jgi:hypothetical protein